MSGFKSWRGVVGMVQPTMRPGPLEDLIRLLPAGIGVIPLYANIREGNRQEFVDAIAVYEARTAELATAGVDLVHPAGTPPFMLLGFERERELIREWEQKYGISIFTSGMNQAAALRALGAKRVLGVTYFGDEVNATYRRYFSEAGFDVVAIAGKEVAFDKVEELSSHEVYRFIKEIFFQHTAAEAIYMFGAAWQTLNIIEMLEADLGVPVLHKETGLCWEIQRRLHVHQPVAGYGRLLRELP